MKKLLTLLFICLAVCMCSKAQDVIPVDPLERFMVTCPALLPDGGRGMVRVARAWCEVPIILADTLVPQSETDAIHGVGNVTGLTLRDFALNVREYDDVMIFSLSANEMLNPQRSRTWWTTKDDLIKWIGYLANYGITIDDLMDADEYKARVEELNPTSIIEEEE